MTFIWISSFNFFQDFNFQVFELESELFFLFSSRTRSLIQLHWFRTVFDSGPVGVQSPPWLEHNSGEGDLFFFG